MEKIKRFCRENARILLALGAVLAFCAVLPVMFAATADRVVGPQLPHGGAAAGRQRDGGRAAPV